MVGSLALKSQWAKRMLPRMFSVFTSKKLNGPLFEGWGHFLLFSECTLTHTDLEPLRLVAVSVSKA